VRKGTKSRAHVGQVKLLIFLCSLSGAKRELKEAKSGKQQGGLEYAIGRTLEQFEKQTGNQVMSRKDQGGKTFSHKYRMERPATLFIRGN